MQKHRRQLPAVQCIKSSAEILFTCLFCLLYVDLHKVRKYRVQATWQRGAQAFWGAGAEVKKKMYVQTLVPQIIHTFDMIFIYKASHILENRKECNLMASKLYSRHTSWLFFEGPYYFFLSQHTMNDTCGLHNVMAVG